MVPGWVWVADVVAQAARCDSRNSAYHELGRVRQVHLSARLFSSIAKRCLTSTSLWHILSIPYPLGYTAGGTYHGY